VTTQQVYEVAVERQKAAQAAGNYDLADLPGGLAEPAAAARVGKVPKQDKILAGGKALGSVAQLHRGRRWRSSGGPSRAGRWRTGAAPARRRP
jgi:hypothetical protein